jgi:hypothetical protein
MAFLVFFILPALCLGAGFSSRECLHCHAGARSFEEGVVHAADPDLLPALRANKTSCVSSGCHDMVPNVRSLKDAKFWKGGT